MALEKLYQDMDAVVPPEYYMKPGSAIDISMLPQVPDSLGLDPISAYHMKFAPYTLVENEAGGQTVAAIDKIGAHSPTDVLLTVYGEEQPALTFKDTTPESNKMLLSWMHRFVTYASDPQVSEQFNLRNGFVRMGVNVDPYTEDRTPIQGVKMLHPHCICFPEQRGEKQSKVLDYTHPNYEVRSVVDPLALVGPRVIEDSIFKHPLPESMARAFSYVPFDPEYLVQNNMPFGIHLQLNRSWDSLVDPQMGEALADLHDLLEGTYYSVREAFTGKDADYTPKQWERPQLLDPDVIDENIGNLPDLSSATRCGLKSLAAGLRSISDEEMAKLKDGKVNGKEGLAEKTMTLAGPAYTMTFYSPGTIADMRNAEGWQTPAYLVIQPVLFQPCGAAGLNFDPNGDRYKVDRSGAVPAFTDEEKIMRSSFHNGYIRRLR